MHQDLAQQKGGRNQTDRIADTKRPTTDPGNTNSWHATTLRKLIPFLQIG
jgi:hypothetical protein